MSTIKIKRSAVASKVPLTTDLELGELAINTYDGKIFLKKDDGSETVLTFSDDTSLSGLSTNLSTSANTTTRTVASSTGTNAVLPGANSTTAGVMTSSDYSKLAGIESGATADQSAAEILAALLTVDGAGSGLDADLLDGHDTSYFANSTHTHSGVYEPADATILKDADIGVTVQAYSSVLAATTASFLTADETKLDGIEAGAQVNVATNLSTSANTTTRTVASSTGTNVVLPAANSTQAGVMLSTDKSKLDGIEAGATADMSASEILTAVKTVDGSGSGLDADLWDGNQFASYLNQAVLTTSTPTFANTTINGTLSATTKSFVIDHPSKPGMKLRHGSLEGPEDGVYIRGKTSMSWIPLPDYWTDLVDLDSITVQLTSIGLNEQLYVESIGYPYVNVHNSGGNEYFYFIQASRKDVPKWPVEYTE